MNGKGQIVVDTGPLISLEKLSHGYAFIRQMYDSLLVPSGVLVEVAQGQFNTPQDYIDHYQIADVVDVRDVSVSYPSLRSSLLHPGESQAIQLALNLNLLLLIEETAGRTLAQSLGLHISGIAGQINQAFRLGLLTQNAAYDMLTELFVAGRINRKIYAALTAALEL